MELALAQDALDLVGLARPLCMNPDLPRELMTGSRDVAETYSLTVGFLDKLLVPALNNLWHQRQIHLLAAHKSPNPRIGYSWLLTVTFVRTYFIGKVRAFGPMALADSRLCPFARAEAQPATFCRSTGCSCCVHVFCTPSPAALSLGRQHVVLGPMAIAAAVFLVLFWGRNTTFFNHASDQSPSCRTGRLA